METDTKLPNTLNLTREYQPTERERGYMEALDSELHGLWGLGKNIVMLCAPLPRGMELVVIPHYVIAEFAGRKVQSAARRLLDEVMSGYKLSTNAKLREVASMLGYDITTIALPFTPGDDLGIDLVEATVKRYGITYCEDRAVTLFDIVGFSLLSPLEQVTQLNALSYSVNSAYAKMLNRELDISFARTTTGDGFYIWNRDRSIQANVNLYHFMHLVLADNAIARRKAVSENITPKLRTCFHIGGHYEFYQSEGLSPTILSFIVGDVTIELARMIERAVPGQVLVGDFKAPMPDRETGAVEWIDSIEFIERTAASLGRLQGLVLSDDEIESIKCYLTGDKLSDGAFVIKRYCIGDKHGLTRNVFNAKVNIYRRQAEPIFLGVLSDDMDGFVRINESVVAEAGV